MSKTPRNTKGESVTWLESILIFAFGGLKHSYESHLYPHLILTFGAVFNFPIEQHNMSKYTKQPEQLYQGGLSFRCSLDKLCLLR